ncbi:MAG: tRNA (adenosine(37)-N6)-threonylcarbamoyltransferase complex transferase subunit TsaD [Candidatus Omnitrophota bacterium]
MITLGIETSCDETSAAVIASGRVLSSEISSSVHLHSRYGGVIPEIACRFHVEYIFPVVKKALEDAGRTINEIDLVAVTGQPGLPGSLLVGGAFARGLSFARGVPLIEVNHAHAHIVSCFLKKKEEGDILIEVVFPFIGAVASGGHTSIYVCKSFRDFTLIGSTRDDAVGEAFDKVAKILELGYPGGPVVEERALDYVDKHDDAGFPRALLEDKDDLDFSFSGIKTAVMRYWQKSGKTDFERNKICFSFQEAVVDIVEEKLIRAVKKTGIRKLALGGGVINNQNFRERLLARCEKETIELFLPRREYCSDNAAMVAALGERLVC